MHNVDKQWFEAIYLNIHYLWVQLKLPFCRNEISDLNQTTENLSIFQGGSLCCAQFLIFSNNLSCRFIRDMKDLQLVQYADNTTLMKTMKLNLPNTIRTLEKRLIELENYYCPNRTKINPDKTGYCHRYEISPEIFPYITIDFHIAKIIEQPSIKILGLHLEKHLEFNEYIDHLVRKSMIMISCINQA